MPDDWHICSFIDVSMGGAVLHPRLSCENLKIIFENDIHKIYNVFSLLFSLFQDGINILEWHTQWEQFLNSFVSTLVKFCLITEKTFKTSLLKSLQGSVTTVASYCMLPQTVPKVKSVHLKGRDHHNSVFKKKKNINGNILMLKRRMWIICNRGYCPLTQSAWDVCVGVCVIFAHHCLWHGYRHSHADVSQD